MVISIISTANNMNSRRIDDNCNTNKGVAFSTVEIREYERCLGNHPPTIDLNGPSLSIDWKYESKGMISIHDYEKYKEQKMYFIVSSEVAADNKRTTTTITRRRNNYYSNDNEKFVIPLTSTKRKSIIQEHCISNNKNCNNNIEKEINTNIKQFRKIINQRKETSMMQSYDEFQFILTSIVQRYHRRRRVQKLLHKAISRRQRYNAIPKITPITITLEQEQQIPVEKIFSINNDKQRHEGNNHNSNNRSRYSVRQEYF